MRTHVRAVGANWIVGHAQVDGLGCVERADRGQRAGAEGVRKGALRSPEEGGGNDMIAVALRWSIDRSLLRLVSMSVNRTPTHRGHSWRWWSGSNAQAACDTHGCRSGLSAAR